jgi:DNA-binding response OmpR family regulator
MDIIIIDDEAVNLTMMKQLVGKLPNCNALGFTEPTAALAWCKANDPDVVIVGYVMPSFNGIEFVEQVRKLDGRSETPVLMVTASTNLEIRARALESGVNDFLNKPFDATDLQARVMNMIAIRADQKKVSPIATLAPTKHAAAQPVAPNWSSHASSKPVLNIEATLTRLSGDDTLMYEVARTFIRTVPNLLAAIASAIATNNMERVDTEAHSLKGAVAAFDATEVYNAVVILEAHALNNDAAAAAAAFSRAQALVVCLDTELRALTQRNAV